MVLSRSRTTTAICDIRSFGSPFMGHPSLTRTPTSMRALCALQQRLRRLDISDQDMHALCPQCPFDGRDLGLPRGNGDDARDPAELFPGDRYRSIVDAPDGRAVRVEEPPVHAPD